MNKLRVVFIGLAMAGFQFAFAGNPGNKALPQRIATAFSAKYPHAMIKSWTFRQNNYSIGFVSDKRKCTAVFSTDGAWMWTKVKLPWMKDLPLAVRESLAKSSYRAYYIDKISEVKNAGGNITYVVRVDGSSGDWDVLDHLDKDFAIYYTPNGTLIQTTRLTGKDVAKQ